MSGYKEMNADEREAARLERESQRLAAEARADEDREIDLDAYAHWWLNKVAL